MSGGLQSPARCPDCGAHLTLRMDCTRGETWPCTCQRGPFNQPPPESIAATVEAADWPACLGCGRDVVPTCDADDPVCPDCIDTYDGSPATPEERAAIARIHDESAADQRLETLRDALRWRAETWRTDADGLDASAAWAAEPAASSLRGQARRARAMAHQLEALLAAQAGDERDGGGR